MDPLAKFINENENISDDTRRAFGVDLTNGERFTDGADKTALQLLNAGQGATKTILDTALSVGELGRGIQKGISRAGEAVLGDRNPFQVNEDGKFSILDEESVVGQAAADALELDNRSERVGGFVGDVATLAVPGVAAERTLRGASLLTRSLSLGGIEGGVQAVKDGEINQNTAIAATLGTLAPAVGDVVISAVGRFRGTSASAVDSSLDTLESAVESNSQRLLSTNNIDQVDSILSKELDRVLRGVDVDEASAFRSAITETISNISNPQGLSNFLAGLRRAVSAKSLEDVRRLAPSDLDIEIESISRQIQDNTDQLSRLANGLEGEQLTSFVDDSVELLRLQRQLAVIPEGFVSDLQAARRTRLRGEIDVLTERLNNANPNFRGNLNQVEALARRGAELASLNRQTTERAGALVRDPAVVDNPSFVSDELDNILVKKQTQTGQVVETSIPSAQALAGKLEKRTFAFRKEKYDSKRGRDKQNKTLKDALVEKMSSMIRGVELLEREQKEIFDAIDASSAFYNRSGALADRNVQDLTIFTEILNERALVIGKAIGLKGTTNEIKEEVANDLTISLLARHSKDVVESKGADIPGVVKELGVFDEADLKNLPSPEVADELLDRLSQKYRGVAAFDSAAEKIREYNRGKLRQLVDNRIVTADEAKFLEETYPNYVPISREIVEGDPTIIPVSGKIDDTIRTLYGSELPIINVIDASISKGQKINRQIANNGVRQKYGALVSRGLEDDLPGYKGFDIEPYGDGTVPKDGKARFDFYGRDGKRYFVSHKDKNLVDPFLFVTEDLGPELRALNFVGKGTSLFAQLLTRYNPAFKAVSLFRDSVESMFVADGLGANGVIGPARFAKSFKAVSDGLAGKDTPNGILYRQAKEDGIGFGTYSAIFREDGQTFNGVKDIIKNHNKNKIFGAVDNANEVLENSIRFAHYSRALEDGATRLQAATIAKEAGINFSKRGTASKYFEPLFVFMNATIQGNVNMIRALARPRTMVAMVGTTAAAAGSLEFWNSSVHENWRDGVDSFILASNIVIATGWDDEKDELIYSTLPIPHALRPFWVMENNALRVAKGDLSNTTAAFEVMEEFATLLNPTGGRVVDSNGQTLSPEGILQSATPTLARPLTNIALNRNFFGSEVIQYDTDPETGDQIARELPESFGDELDEKISLKLSQILRAATGGEGKWSDARSIKEVLRGVAYVGVVDEAADTINLLDSILDEDELTEPTRADIPVLNRFLRRSNPNTQWVRDRDKLYEQLRLLGDDPKAQVQAIHEHVVKDTTVDKLGFNPAYRLPDGIDVPPTNTRQFGNHDENAAFSLFLSQTSQDEEVQKAKELFKDVLQREKPQQYGYYVEWEAAAAGVLQKTESEIKKFFSDRGVTLTTYKKSGRIRQSNLDNIESKYFKMKRLSASEDIVATYDTFDNVSQLINDGQLPSPEEMLQLEQQQSSLVESGYLSKKELEDKLEKQTKLWFDEKASQLETQHASGELSTEQLIIEAKSYKSDLVNKRVRDYLVRQGENL